MIPAMTDPLGKYWDQPHDIRNVVMDDVYAILTPRQFNELAEYSATMPTGVYPGKCWKRVQKDSSFLVWYGECEDPKLCTINKRIILLVEE